MVVTCKNPDPKRPGHIAIVRPSTKSDQRILAEGPDIIQAGAHHYTRTTAREGFKNHPGAYSRMSIIRKSICLIRGDIPKNCLNMAVAKANIRFSAVPDGEKIFGHRVGGP